MMSVLSDYRRIGDNDTESVEPNGKVTIVFFGHDIHGKPVSLAGGAAAQVSIEWIGKRLWWGGTSFNAPAPVFHDMRQIVVGEWRYSFTMVGYDSYGPPTGAQFLCVEAAVSYGEFVHWRQRYCIPRRPADGPGLARRRFPRRRLIPTPDTTGLARDSCKR